MTGAISPHDPEASGSQPETGRPSPAVAASSFLAKARENITFRSVWGELNGAMGDLGTYIPIVLALSLADDLDLGTTLIFTGVYNIVTGLLYGVPMPVQPMKAIASAAISSHGSFGVPEMMAAGILTSGTVFVLGATHLIQLAYWLIPLPVVRGIQLAQGLNFALAAVRYVRYKQNLAKGQSLGQRPWAGLDGLILAIIAACFIVLVNGAGNEAGDDHEEKEAGAPSGKARRRRLWNKLATSIPSAVILFVLGVVLAIIRKPSTVNHLHAGPSAIHVVKFSKHAWKQGFTKGALPQIPLTVLNSVIAVCKLSKDLFPEKAAPATSVSLTVGAMNLVGCWFGAMPCCHGAGGLAGQYKFGGRSGGCVAALGALKLLLGLVLGGSMLRVLDEFPVGLLGVLLLFAGIELAMAARDMLSKAEVFVMLVTTSVSMVGSSAGLGFICGTVAHCLIEIRKLVLK